MTDLPVSGNPLHRSNDVSHFAIYHGIGYAGSFSRIQLHRWHPNFNVAAFLFGPLWAAWRGLWPSYYVLVGGYLAAISLVYSWSSEGESATLWPGGLVA